MCCILCNFRNLIYNCVGSMMVYGFGIHQFNCMVFSQLCQINFTFGCQKTFQFSCMYIHVPVYIHVHVYLLLIYDTAQTNSLFNGIWLMYFASDFRESKISAILLSTVFFCLLFFVCQICFTNMHVHVVCSDYRYLNLDLLVFVINDSFLVFIF